MSIEKVLIDRCEGKCELCGAKEGLVSYQVTPKEEEIVICNSCSSSIEEPTSNEKHWNCLHDSMWSVHPAVQVMAFRLLTKLGAQEQLEMLYLEPEVQEWAESGLEDENIEPTRDSNGTTLKEGDSVTVIKDLVVKGAGFTAKQGTTVKNIHLVYGNSEQIEGRVNGTRIVLLSKFLKKL